MIILIGGKKTLPEKYPLDGSFEDRYRSGPKTGSEMIIFLDEEKKPMGSFY